MLTILMSSEMNRDGVRGKSVETFSVTDSSKLSVVYGERRKRRRGGGDETEGFRLVKLESETIFRVETTFEENFS